MNSLVLDVFLMSILGGALGFVGALFCSMKKLGGLILDVKRVQSDVQTLKIQMAALHAEFYRPFQDPSDLK